MNEKEYRAVRAGARVRTTRAIRNHHFEIPEGTVMAVTRKWSGFHLTADPCEHCGVRLHITRVDRQHVELVAD